MIRAVMSSVLRHNKPQARKTEFLPTPLIDRR